MQLTLKISVNNNKQHVFLTTLVTTSNPVATPSYFLVFLVFLPKLIKIIFLLVY